MDDAVLVQVMEVDGGRQIGWGGNAAQPLVERLSDLRDAIAAGSRAAAGALAGIEGADGWRVGEVTASFGVTLTAEAGALIAKTQAGATFEVKVTYSPALRQ